MSLFQAKYQNGITFKRIIDSVKDMIKTICLEIDEEGIRMQAMDSAHVSLITFFLPKASFTSLFCNKPFSIGITVEQISKVMNCMTQGDNLTLECDESPNNLRIFFENPSTFPFIQPKIVNSSFL